MVPPYRLGLDIGIASVGWCLLAEDHIIDLGVRAFDKAETAKEGESLNLARRMARLMRRRLHRRAWRLKKLARALKRHGLIADARFFSPENPCKEKNLWRLRVEGLDRHLAPQEWARVIYHIAKHRGFHWISKAEKKAAEADAKGESGKVKQGLDRTCKLMEEKGYRSPAEMLLKEIEQENLTAFRNKRGEYTKALSRVLLGEELKALFAAQRQYGNPHADATLEAEILGNGDKKSGIFWQQKPALSGENLLKMLGKCTFERNENRAPKASFTAERHIWLTRLNNLRIVVDGRLRSLNAEERKVALPLPYAQASDLSYKQLRAALTKAGFLGADGFKFAGLSYPSERQKSEGKVKDPEGAVLVKLPAWQTMRKQLESKGLKTEWESMAGAAQTGSPQQLDEIARVLSVYKEGEEVDRELRKLALPGGEKMVEALSELSFDKFSNLSLKALYQIMPFMEQGQRYDEACVSAGYHHSQLHSSDDEKECYLPPFYSGRGDKKQMVFRDDLDIPRNPVVLRALNQARKVVNAIVRHYGSPVAVHIEMARDLSRPLNERNKIKKEQDEFRARNERDKAEFAQQFSIVGQIKGRDFEKWRLYREQSGKCAYSLHPIDITRLLTPGYVEVDHVLPWSRSFDDSKNNKVLAFKSENQAKGNRTPYEYLTSFPGGEESEHWRGFVAFVEGNKNYRQAKRSRLLRKGFDVKDAEEFRERNLNDTRYICRFFKNYVERYLKLANREDGSTAQRCVVLSGQMTAFLRARWGLLKIRAESDRHHALDAAVVAACSHAMVKRLSDYSRKKELEQIQQGLVDIETGEIIDPAQFSRLVHDFPDPWPHFHRELEVRLKMDDAAKIRSEVERLDTYSAEELDALRSLFVSRAPQRRNSGAAHKDTIYGKTEQKGSVTQKVALSSLNLADMDKLVDPHRNERLYAAIRKRLEEYGGKGDKAFPAGTEFRKPDKNGNPTGPIVRTVTMVIDKLSGIPVRGGIAKNDTMLRVDVFSKAGRFYLVPVYVHHIVAGLPNRAIVAHKDEEEWDLIDESFVWCFSLYPNDLVKITTKKMVTFGYYASTHRGTGNMNIWAHDRNQAIGKEGFIEGIGVKTALKLEKFEVDVLGNIYPARPEPRRGLA
ncbi:MAG: type II CRISPR RNA-guided endonuclease Cas9 [Helicobacteraceae bacterium]|jgi:CRISPR-associated endonuclease Csn1|nr:type II CRISPR RNA-guided endonuclease Cas9 [Helicobacteraceae bacterium]